MQAGVECEWIGIKKDFKEEEVRLAKQKEKENAERDLLSKGKQKAKEKMHGMENKKEGEEEEEDDDDNGACERNLTVLAKNRYLRVLAHLYSHA